MTDKEMVEHLKAKGYEIYAPYRRVQVTLSAVEMVSGTVEIEVPIHFTDEDISERARLEAHDTSDFWDTQDFTIDNYDIKDIK